MKFSIVKKVISLLITFSLLVSPELMAAVTNPNQEKMLQELVEQYNKEVHTYGDFQEFAKKHSAQGLENFQFNIAKVDKKMKAPKLEYKNGKIQTEILGEKLAFEMASNNIKLNLAGKQFDLVAAKNLKFSAIRPALNYMLVSILNQSKDLKSSLALLEKNDPMTAKKIKDYASSGKGSDALVFPKFQATDEYIVYKDSSEQEIFIKLLSENEIEMKAYGKVFKFNSQLSPSDIEVILKKELTSVAPDKKISIEKIVNLFIGSAYAGSFEGISKVYDNNRQLGTCMVAITAAMLAPTWPAYFIVVLLWMLVADPAIAATLHHLKKNEILEMLSKCANGSDENTKVDPIVPNEYLKEVSSVSLEEALAKFDKFEEICSNDTKCSINNDLARCKLKTIKLYKSVDTTSRGQPKARAGSGVRQGTYDSSAIGK